MSEGGREGGRKRGIFLNVKDSRAKHNVELVGHFVMSIWYLNVSCLIFILEKCTENGQWPCTCYFVLWE